MQLETIAENIWGLRGPMRIPLFGDIGARMTVIRLKDGSLMLISPVKFGAEIKAKLQELGNVRYLVAPNSHHHLFLPHAKSAFPQARVYGPASLQEKRKNIPFADCLSEKENFPWSEEVAQLHIPGRAHIDEFVFFHRATKTMIVTDLLFNLREGKSFISRCALKMNNARGFGMTKIGRYVFNDRKLLKEKVDQFIAWQPERIVVSHGEVVTSNGVGLLKNSFGWMKLNAA